MLYLTRKTGQSIMIGDEVEISVVEVRGKTVKLGLNFPKHISVLRREIYDRVKFENQQAFQPVDLNSALNDLLKPSSTLPHTTPDDRRDDAE